MIQFFNKKGSITIFLTSILITMIMASMVFVHAARSISGASYSDAVLELAGRSVLSEFDRRLWEEYGIFAFYGSPELVAYGIDFYASAAFDKTLPREFGWFTGAVTDLFRLKLQRVDVCLASYSLADLDIFEEQVIAASWIPSVHEVLDSGLRSTKVNEYILERFQYHVGGDKDKNTVFKNEVEYILHGRMSDKENLNRFMTEFVLMRTPLNSGHILTCANKRRAVLALAKTFGPAAPAAFVVLVAAWSLAEAENDTRLLMAGKNVAMVKTCRTWALDLRNAVRTVRITDDEGNIVDVEATPREMSIYVSPKSPEGMSYVEYLRFFLYLEKRETKLQRMMDLIQMNFRSSYYEEFSIGDHYTGFSLTAVVSGKKFEYEQKY